MTHHAGSGPACTPESRSSGHDATVPASSQALFTAQLRTDGQTSRCSRGGRDWMRYGRAHAGSRAAIHVSGTANSMKTVAEMTTVVTGNSQKSGSRYQARTVSSIRGSVLGRRAGAERSSDSGAVIRVRRWRARQSPGCASCFALRCRPEKRRGKCLIAAGLDGEHFPLIFGIGRRKPGGTARRVAVGGIITSSVTFGSAGSPVSG